MVKIIAFKKNSIFLLINDYYKTPFYAKLFAEIGIHKTIFAFVLRFKLRKATKVKRNRFTDELPKSG